MDWSSFRDAANQVGDGVTRAAGQLQTAIGRVGFRTWDNAHLMDLARRPEAALVVGGQVDGDMLAIERACAAARNSGALAVVVLGGLGVRNDWYGQEFLNRVDGAAAAARVEVWFVDGCRDNIDELAARRRGHGGPMGLTDRVFHLPRGFRLTLAGVDVGFMGGGFSRDWQRRRFGVDVFAAELPTDEQAARLGPWPVRVLCTHQEPRGLNDPLEGLEGEDRRRAEQVRDVLGRLVDRTRPATVLYAGSNRTTRGVAFPDEPFMPPPLPAPPPLVAGPSGRSSAPPPPPAGSGHLPPPEQCRFEALSPAATPGGLVHLHLPSAEVTEVNS